MKHIKYHWLTIFLTVLFVILLAGCNLPTNTDESTQQTAVAQTEAANVGQQPSQTAVQVTATATEPAGSEGTSSQNGSQTPEASPTSIQLPSTTLTPTEEEIGEDRAEFISDVTIPDYSEVQTGEEITKTWRVRNSGTTTWTTDYVVEFNKGEILGAPSQIKLPKSVKPNEFIDISIDFTVPTATGEHSSYWILKNADGQRVGVAEEGKFFTMYMVIMAVSDSGDGGTSSSGGISGGAKVTNATVSVDDASYSGSCPAQLTFTYKVTTSNAGKVNFKLKFGVVSPAGYKFDPPPDYSVDFTGGYTVTYSYTLFSSNSVNATVKVEAIGSNTFTSDPVSFKVNCN
jgi:hypothetical protein